MSETEQAVSSPRAEPLPAARATTALALSLVVPGAGHLALGKKALAVSFAAIILTAIAIGCSLDGNLYRVLPDQPLTILATLGSMGMGLPYFILRYAVSYQGDVMSAGYEYGTAFLLTAGLMNLLLVLDVWDYVRGRKV